MHTSWSAPSFLQPMNAKRCLALVWSCRPGVEHAAVGQGHDEVRPLGPARMVRDDRTLRGDDLVGERLVEPVDLAGHRAVASSTAVSSRSLRTATSKRIAANRRSSLDPVRNA